MGGLSVKELCESLPEVRGEEISGCHKKKTKHFLFFFSNIHLLFIKNLILQKLTKKKKGWKFLIYTILT